MSLRAVRRGRIVPAGTTRSNLGARGI